MKLLIAAFLLFVLVNAAYVQSYQIGVSPNILDIGDIRAGESRTLSFKILTVLNETLVVSVGVLEENKDLLERVSSQRTLNYSEESNSGWVEFINNPVELRPAPNSAPGIMGMKEIKFILNVPSNAEPGYHAAKIQPMPYTAEGYGMGTNIIAVTGVSLAFNVLGDAVTDGSILDVIASRTPSNIRIDSYFQNTGTVTMSVGLNRLSLFFANGTLAASTASETARLRPLEIRKFSSIFPSRIPNGEYTASAEFVFGSFRLVRNFTVEISGAEPSLYRGAVLAAESNIWLYVLIFLISLSGASLFLFKKFLSH